MERSFDACIGKGTEYAPEKTGSLGQGLTEALRHYPVRQKRVNLWENRNWTSLTMKKHAFEIIAFISIAAIAKYVYDVSDRDIIIFGLAIFASALFSEMKSMERRLADAEKRIDSLVRKVFDLP